MLVEPKVYFSLWNKYRPVILQLMSASANEPQKYKLFAHEFRALSQKEKLSYSFTLEAAHGKALNNIKTSPVAQSLLQILQQSGRASQLMSEATYELSMDKHFVLHVSRKEPAAAEATLASTVSSEA